MIPQSFDEWKKCITVDCGIKLTSDFTKKRVAILSNLSHPDTKQFVKLYGEQHRNNVVHWLKRAQQTSN
ncbi:MAG: hypothetical protein AAFZ15_00555 [Bacteroidota bacterium]